MSVSLQLRDYLSLFLRYYKFTAMHDYLWPKCINTDTRFKTRNVWQSLAYSQLGVVVSTLANIYEKHQQLITAVPNSPTTSECS